MSIGKIMIVLNYLKLTSIINQLVRITFQLRGYIYTYMYNKIIYKMSIGKKMIVLNYYLKLTSIINQLLSLTFQLRG